MISDDDLEYAVIGGIPLHRHLGISWSGRSKRHEVDLEDLPETRNHLGGQGGAALFGAAEAAGAAAVFELLAPVSDRLFAVPAEAAIRFRRPARGGVLARAWLTGDSEAAVAAVLTGNRAALTVAAEIVDDRGTVVADLDARWHLAPVRPDSPPTVPRRPPAERGRGS